MYAFSTFRLHLIIMAFLVFPSLLIAQSKPQNPYLEQNQKNKWIFEGIVGFQFGTITLIEASPLAGYKITPAFAAGLGATYQYSNYRDFYLNTENETLVNRTINILGGRLFTRYYLSKWLEGILNGLFAHAEYEFLTYKRNFVLDANGKYVDRFGYPYSKGEENIRVPGLLVGGGLNQPLGKSAYASILILYNLNETRNTPYKNPVFRIGFGFGL